MEDEKFLTEHQLSKLDESSQAFQLIERDIIIARLKHDLARKELTLLSANYTLKSKEASELENAIKEVQELKKKQNEKHLKMIKQITEDLDLPSKWGYDPDTGEIK